MAPTWTRASARCGPSSGWRRACSTRPRPPCRAAKRRAPRWPPCCSPATTCSCWTSRPTTSTSPRSSTSRPSWPHERPRWSWSATTERSWSAPSPAWWSWTSTIARPPATRAAGPPTSKNERSPGATRPRRTRPGRTRSPACRVGCSARSSGPCRARLGPSELRRTTTSSSSGGPSSPPRRAPPRCASPRRRWSGWSGRPPRRLGAPGSCASRSPGPNAAARWWPAWSRRSCATATSPSGPSTSRSRGRTASPSSGRTGPASPPCWPPCSAASRWTRASSTSAPAWWWARWTSPGACWMASRPCWPRSRLRPVCARRARPAPCWPSSAWVPRRWCGPPAPSHPASAPARCSPCCRPGA